ncbi:MAG TPA: dodecin family protein [Acidobacteriota bacterium]|nr:dodecin family protein [bacterium]HNX18726.1 dodecin family protein [Acidobacteriota bacterium]
MADRVYKKVTVVGCAGGSLEQAIQAAVAKAGETLHGLAWFEVKEIRGAVGAGAVTEWQVTVDLAFKVD